MATGHNSFALTLDVSEDGHFQTWHTWSRVVISRAPFPSPKALATLVQYGDDLLLYGGFSKSSPNPIHQTSTFYSELHLYSTAKNQWIEVSAHD